ncbi:hypothetical protein BV22DRAFT_1003552 [Leucogyrophana mollusca]|uniref:Uncharacterized protein n=1 Tax=Leucogyrophana mollusca TaxID=85980 RepID=A0ACB8BSX4_9AGAM|nr:hypothetical protein BV22DRAFT_1003552 [Leucogyrophana mollusca]
MTHVCAACLPPIYLDSYGARSFDNHHERPHQILPPFRRPLRGECFSAQTSTPRKSSRYPRCQICGAKTKYVDKSGVQHPYCSRTCARDRPAKAIPTCLLDNCKVPGVAGFVGFCSEDHAKKGVLAGLVPGCAQCALPQGSGMLCTSCAKQAPAVTRLLEINNSSTIWREFVREWRNEWRTTQGSATVEKLYEITYPSNVIAEKDAHRQKLESAGRIQLLRTFHASQCICDMGTKSPKMCSWNSCGICNVVGSAFKGVAFGVPHNKGRHGDGLYTSQNPARADFYATSCLSSPFRVMVACDVVLPKNLSKSSSVRAPYRPFTNTQNEPTCTDHYGRPSCRS